MGCSPYQLVQDFFHQQQGRFLTEISHGNASVGFFEPKQMEENQYWKILFGQPRPVPLGFCRPSVVEVGGSISTF